MTRPKYKRVKTSDGVVLKSGLEEAVYNFLNKNSVSFIYEGMKIVYFQPAIKKTYTPDFPIQNTPLVLETKGALKRVKCVIYSASGATAIIMPMASP